jgi:hypothetical protein
MSVRPTSRYRDQGSHGPLLSFRVRRVDAEQRPFSVREEVSAILIHQSDMSAYNRCPAEFGYRRAGIPGMQTSASAYGSVMHYALQVFERVRVQEGFDLGVTKAKETFRFYWNPQHIEAICDPVPAKGWLPRQGYSELLSRGTDAITKYADLIRFDDHELLATEFAFYVPVQGTWDYEANAPHYLAGSVDRLAARHYSRALAVCVDDFKGLALDTPLPTPNGWTTMGAVRVGDSLFDQDGYPTVVTGKSRVKSLPCFRLTFDDASSVVCDEEHLWALSVGGRDRRSVVWSARQIFERGVFNDTARPQRDLRVVNPVALDLPEAMLPIAPYVLGYWLGNGKASDGSFCAHEDDVKYIVAAIEGSGFSVGPAQRKSTNSKGDTHTIYGLGGLLKAAGLWKNKHVPSVYLRASSAQRLELIRGLMDSDGHANKVRSEQVFTTVDPALYVAFKDLIASMGWNQSSWVGPRTGFGKTVTAYDVKFRPVDVNPYYLPRKAMRVPLTHALSRQRIIQKVEAIESVPTQCIAVANASQTYLCTDRMTVTHNTGKEQKYLRHNLQFTAYCYATTQLDFWTGGDMEDGFGQKRGTELFERFANAGRRGTWINMRLFKFQDAGWRGPIDYQRFALACDQLALAIQSNIFPLTLNGESCTFCSHRDTCGGTGVAQDDHGKPVRV